MVTPPTTYTYGLNETELETLAGLLNALPDCTHCSADQFEGDNWTLVMRALSANQVICGTDDRDDGAQILRFFGDQDEALAYLMESGRSGYVFYGLQTVHDGPRPAWFERGREGRSYYVDDGSEVWGYDPERPDEDVQLLCTFGLERESFVEMFETEDLRDLRRKAKIAAGSNFTVDWSTMSKAEVIEILADVCIQAQSIPPPWAPGHHTS
jgi:hypothetical protein